MPCVSNLHYIIHRRRPRLRPSRRKIRKPSGCHPIPSVVPDNPLCTKPLRGRGRHRDGVLSTSAPALLSCRTFPTGSRGGSGPRLRCLTTSKSYRFEGEALRGEGGGGLNPHRRGRSHAVQYKNRIRSAATVLRDERALRSGTSDTILCISNRPAMQHMQRFLHAIDIW